MAERDSRQDQPLILLVDDDPHLLALLSGALQANGFKVALATSAAMAIAMYGEGLRPALALIDLHMPDISGMQLAEKLRSGALSPFVMMSVSSGAIFAARAAELGAVGYLAKPVDLHQLISTVIAGIARGREIRSLSQLTARLTASMHDSREAGVAIGMLMQKFRIDRAVAARSLDDYARNQQLPLAQAALGMIEALTEGGQDGVAPR